MLRIYDKDHAFVDLVEKCKDLCITTTLETGTKTLSFKLPLTDETLAIIDEEYYVETDDASYVVKEVNLSQNNYISIFCNPNLEDLKYNLISVFDAFDINIEQCMQKVLTQSKVDWTLEFNSTLKDAVEYKVAETTPFQLFELIKEDYDLEIFYDTKNRIVKVYDHMGEDRGLYFSNELRLKLLSKQGQSYDLATVLYPIGKDGLTIGVVNNGINLIENFDFCNKYLPQYWVQEDIEHAEQLKMAAEAYLSYVSAPIVSYSLELSALPQETQIGDNIILVDKIKRTRQRQRVVKIINYPFTPERDKVEISNQIVNFAETFTKFNNDYKKQIAYIKKNLTTLS